MDTDSQFQQFANKSVLCWLATVSDTGQPNVSPKEIFSQYDSDHLVVANIASPSTVRNIGLNPKVCVSFIDIFVQKGFKVEGIASIVNPDDPSFEIWCKPLKDIAGPRIPINSVIVIKKNKATPIIAPSYWLFPQHTTEASQIDSAMKTYGVTPVIK